MRIANRQDYTLLMSITRRSLKSLCAVTVLWSIYTGLMVQCLCFQPTFHNEYITRITSRGGGGGATEALRPGPSDSYTMLLRAFYAMYLLQVTG